MSYTVRIPTPLQKFTAGAETVACEAPNLEGLLVELSTRFPEIKDRICEADGKPRRFFNVYVNDEDIRFLGGNGYQFNAGDDVLILPSIAGGR